MIAINEDGIESAPISYSFKIKKPFWQTWFFRVTLLVIAFALVIVFVKLREKRMRNKLNSQKKVIELELKALRSQMNPHFVGNCMNTINNLVSQNSDKSIKYISKVSKLFRQVLETSREEFVSLDEEVSLLNDYLALQSEFSNKFNYSFHIDDRLPIETTLLPPMFLQPIIENAIIHGIPNANQKGDIQIKIEQDED